jgi:glycerophosphoryl diester phosphodiesterase
MILIGHRGARKEAPENTLEGFRHLRQLGIHHVELDVRLSKDEQLVVLHDSTVNRTTASNGYVHDFSAEELQQMDATKPIAHWPAVSGIPLLDTVISQWPELKSIQLEVKTADHNTLSVIAHKLKELIQHHRLHSKAIVTSADQQLLTLMHQIAPRINRGFVAERFTRGPLEVCLSQQCSHLILNHHRCTQNLIRTAHQLGLEVSTWTVNDVNAARRLKSWGVDSIITDIPSTLLKHLHVEPA